MISSFNPSKKAKKPTSTTCGVKVFTWGSSPNAGNGMLHFLDTKLFGGNVGHASIQLTFPDNERGRELLAFCKQNNIPCRARTITTFDKSKNVVFQEKVIEAEWSWWPGEGGSFLSNLHDDRTMEREAVAFEWDPKWKAMMAPEERHHKGKIGSRVMAYGPRWILHGRDLSAEDRQILEAGLELEDTKGKVESLGLLQERLNNLIKKFKSDSDRVSLGDTEGLILNRFFPNWKQKIKDSKQITKTEAALLLEITKTELKKLDSIFKLKAIYVATYIRSNITNNLPCPINVEVIPDLKAFIKKLRKNEVSKLEEVINSLDNLAKEGKVTLDQDLSTKLDALNEYLKPERWENKIQGLLPNLTQVDVKILRDLAQEKLTKEVVPSQLNQAQADRLIQECGDRIKTISSENEFIDRHFKARNLKILRDFLFSYKDDEGNTIADEKFIKKLDALNEYIKPKTWKDKITGSLPELTKSDINTLYNLAAEKFDIAEKDMISFREDLAHYSIGREEDKFLSIGKPPDGVVSLPIRPLGDSTVGFKNGLDIESMLKKMVSLTKDGNFELYTKNCSKTTDAILEAGALESYQKDFFRGKAFGFFGNPQQSYNHAIEFQAFMQNGKPGFNPLKVLAGVIEKGGGFLIGVLMDNKSNILQKGLAFLGGVVLSPFALVAFVVPKIFSPADTFKDIMGLIQFANSRNSPTFKWATRIVMGIVAIPFAPFAAAKAAGIAILAFFQGPPKVEKAAVSDEEENRVLGKLSMMVNAHELPQRAQALGQQLTDLQNKRELMDKFVSIAIKRDMIEVAVEKGKSVTEQAITALKTFKQILEDPSRRKKIPSFSNQAVKAIQEYIKKGNELPKDLATVIVDGKEVKQTASELYNKLCSAALERTKEKQKTITASYQPGSPEFILNAILLSTFKIAPQEIVGKGIKKFSTNVLKEEFKFLNKLTEKLRDDDVSFVGPEGVKKKAQYLYTATELVYKDLMASKSLTPRQQQDLENKLKQLQGIRSKNEKEDIELETYLVKIAQLSGDRTLVDKYHELIVAEKLREPAVKLGQKPVDQ